MFKIIPLVLSVALTAGGAVVAQNFLQKTADTPVSETAQVQAASQTIAQDSIQASLGSGVSFQEGAFVGVAH